MDEWCAPDACSLPIADQPGRVAEWDTLFATAVRRVETVPGGVRFELDRSRAKVAAVADLADRESQCCAFFSFGVTIARDAVALTVDADPEHVDVVEALTARALRLSGTPAP
jgi:hypothetical protein